MSKTNWRLYQQEKCQLIEDRYLTFVEGRFREETGEQVSILIINNIQY